MRESLANSLGRDQREAMLAAQMAGVHAATRIFGRRLAHGDHLPRQDSAERAFDKLARAFALQKEALKRYRTGGERTVTVQHVHLHDGGQAIVGAVQGIGDTGKAGGNPHEGQAPHAPVFTVDGDLKADEAALPGGGCDRLDGVPVPWRGGGAPKGARNGAYRHGLRTNEAIAKRRAFSELLKECRNSLKVPE